MKAFTSLALLGLASSALSSPILEKRKTPWTRPNKPLNGRSIRAAQAELNSYRARSALEARLVERDGLVPNDTAAPTASASKTNIWRTLSDDEAASVVSFLHKQDWLNLTAAENATDWDNMISVIDVAMPNKTDALKYLDGGGPLPPRFAYASIMFGATEEPYVQDFLVGPLPISSKSGVSSNDFVSTKGKAKIRNYDADGDAMADYISSVAGSVEDIVWDLLGVNATGDDVDIWGIDPLWHQNGRVINWLAFWQIPEDIFDSETLQQMGLYLRLDITGRDPAGWSVTGWLYDDVFYASTKEFRAAWAAGKITHQTKVQGGEWGGTDATTPYFPKDSTPPPMTVEVGPKRYSVDEGKRWVEWMDFSLYLTFTRDTGVRIYDIRYKGERIIYELGLQEALASYAGNDPVQSGTSYLGPSSFYGFGPYAFEAVPGYDCPEYSTFLNATFFADEVARTHRNGICLFETDAGYALQRHSSSKYTSITKNTVFIIRSACTVGNYDYTFDYVFSLDGSIEVIVRASGYIQSTFYAKNGDYGFKIHDALSGSMHDHSLSFKARSSHYRAVAHPALLTVPAQADLDILGTSNSLAAMAIKPCDVKYDWNDFVRPTMKLERWYIDNESDAQLDWGMNQQTQYFIHNKDEKNKYGETRGYRFMPSRGGSGMHATIKDSPNLINSQGFAKHSFFVTKQKDSEPRVANAWNDYDTANPIVDFSKFVDGESIDQEDLVLWFNLGMHHVPHTGDIPNTVMTTAQSGIIISPHNYLLSDPSRATQQQIRITHPNGDANVTEVLTFNASVPSGTIDLSSIQPDYSDYEGDYAVRKFPYDPSHPYNDTEAIV